MTTREQELQERQNVILNTASLEDHLLEDPPVYNQNFFILSYLLPDPNKNELQQPLFKMRGAFKNEEECKKRIKKLKNID